MTPLDATQDAYMIRYISIRLKQLIKVKKIIS